MRLSQRSATSCSRLVRRRGSRPSGDAHALDAEGVVRLIVGHGHEQLRDTGGHRLGHGPDAAVIALDGTPALLSRARERASTVLNTSHSALGTLLFAGEQVRETVSCFSASGRLLATV